MNQQTDGVTKSEILSPINVCETILSDSRD